MVHSFPHAAEERAASLSKRKKSMAENELPFIQYLNNCKCLASNCQWRELIYFVISEVTDTYNSAYFLPKAHGTQMI